MNFFETLIHPDKEENSERAEVARAANLLQVGEFQVLQLAYKEWHGQDLPPLLVDRLFASYMFENKVPSWARHYARNILRLEEQGSLDDMSPAYHRYDSEFWAKPRDGGRRFGMAVALLVLCVGGGIALAEMSTDGDGTSVLPPYFSEQELRSTR
jgi:hypothetical protein